MIESTLVHVSQVETCSNTMWTRNRQTTWAEVPDFMTSTQAWWCGTEVWPGPLGPWDIGRPLTRHVREASIHKGRRFHANSKEAFQTGFVLHLCCSLREGPVGIWEEMGCGRQWRDAIVLRWDGKGLNKMTHSLKAFCDGKLQKKRLDGSNHFCPF